MRSSAPQPPRLASASGMLLPPALRRGVRAPSMPSRPEADLLRWAGERSVGRRGAPAWAGAARLARRRGPPHKPVAVLSCAQAGPWGSGPAAPAAYPTTGPALSKQPTQPYLPPAALLDSAGPRSGNPTPNNGHVLPAVRSTRLRRLGVRGRSRPVPAPGPRRPVPCLRVCPVTPGAVRGTDSQLGSRRRYEPGPPVMKPDGGWRVTRPEPRRGGRRGQRRTGPTRSTFPPEHAPCPPAIGAGPDHVEQLIHRLVAHPAQNTATRLEQIEPGGHRDDHSEQRVLPGGPPLP